MSPEVVIVLPTIPGREGLAEETAKAYRVDDYADGYASIIQPTGFPTIGEAWWAGVEYAHAAGAQYVLLGADDLVPAAGALDAGLESLRDGVYPSPLIRTASGELHSCGTLGNGLHLPDCPTGTMAHASQIPLLPVSFAADHPIPPIHYYADDFLGYVVTDEWGRCEVNRDYCFTHLEGVVGRSRVVQRAASDRLRFVMEVAGRSGDYAEVNPGVVELESA